MEGDGHGLGRIAGGIDDCLIDLLFGGTAQVQGLDVFDGNGAEDIVGDVLVVAAGDQDDLLVVGAQAGDGAAIESL